MLKTLLPRFRSISTALTLPGMVFSATAWAWSLDALVLSSGLSAWVSGP